MSDSDKGSWVMLGVGAVVLTLTSASFDLRLGVMALAAVSVLAGAAGIARGRS